MKPPPDTGLVEPGDVLDGRFEIQRRAASGGMGEVFRGRDLVSGGVVAVKVLIAARAQDHGRFAREIALLSELRHPGIVRYVAHGRTPGGAPFLAMEWLEGEDLAQRLGGRGISAPKALTLIARVAEALSEAHARGIVHRDLKPSNLFLVHGDVAGVKILDFGIARGGDGARMTRTGMVIGTPGYMAPEQARSGQQVDARADVFALGCVLFECLTGVPAFQGVGLMAILAKILFAESPRASAVRPEIPPALDDLCARMLAKDPAARPADGAAVAALIAEGGDPARRAAEGIGPPSPRSAPALTLGERRVISVLLMGHTAPINGDESLSGAETLRISTTPEIRRAAADRGGSLEVLADGSVMVTIAAETRVATDQAAQAARCALALRALCPDRPMALVTSQAEGSGGEAIDRAARMLLAGGAIRAAPAPIAIDGVTAGLLDDRFEVATDAGGAISLVGEQDLAEGARTLLGKRTPCVGRDSELAALEMFVSECFDEPRARPVLITAPAGIGKSRLARELVIRTRQRDQAIAVWTGRIDSIRAGSSFGLLGSAIRGALGVQESAPAEDRRRQILASVEARAPAGDARRIAAFLGEIVGVPFPAEESPALRAARQDPQLMGAQMLAAWVDLLRAELAVRPVLLVLEDLHWGDLPTVRLIDAALREHAERPWMVLALARPEVHARFPSLWAARGIQEICLRELTRKASERIIRQALGDRATGETVDRLVKLSEGHAFYLEELIRAVAEDKGAALPETVLAMVEARLAAQSSEARRALRAASIFGEVCWEGGVARLLGEGPRGTLPNLDELGGLVDRELLMRRPESRFPGDPELAFRHALIREGAYATLTEEDRRLGHKLAGEWLAERGEADPMVLAQHFERGGDPARAAGYFLRAAVQAFRGADNAAAKDRARRGLEGGAEGTTRVSLLTLLAELECWNNEMDAGLAYAEEATRLTTPGTAAWTRAVGVKFASALHLGRIDAAMALVDALKDTRPAPEAVASLALNLAGLVLLLELAGRFDLAAVTLARLDAIVAPCGPEEAVAKAWADGAHSHWEAWKNDDPYAGLARVERCRAGFREAGNKVHTQLAAIFVGMNRWYLGALDEAEAELTATMSGKGIDNRDLGPFSSLRTRILASVLLDKGEIAEAKQISSAMLEAGRAQRVPQDEGRGRWALADVLLREGDLDAAEREARAALDLLKGLPLERLTARATLAAVLLGEGRVAEALALCEEVRRRMDAMGAIGLRGGFIRLVHAEALYAAGQRAEASAAIGAARDRVLGIADKIEDPILRRAFFEQVPENARTLRLAREWSG